MAEEQAPSLPSSIDEPSTSETYPLHMLNYHLKILKCYRFMVNFCNARLTENVEMFDEVNETYTELEAKFITGALTAEEQQLFGQHVHYKIAIMFDVHGILELKEEYTEMVKETEKTVGHWRLIINGFRCDDVNGKTVYELIDD